MLSPSYQFWIETGVQRGGRNRSVHFFFKDTAELTSSEFQLNSKSALIAAVFFPSVAQFGFVSNNQPHKLLLHLSKITLNQ